MQFSNMTPDDIADLLIKEGGDELCPEFIAKIIIGASLEAATTLAARYREPMPTDICAEQADLMLEVIAHVTQRWLDTLPDTPLEDIVEKHTQSVNEQIRQGLSILSKLN